MARPKKEKEEKKKNPLLDEGQDGGPEQNKTKEDPEIETPKEKESEPQTPSKQEEFPAYTPPVGYDPNAAIREAEILKRKTEKFLEEDEQVSFYIPLGPGEKVGAMEVVSLNGVRYEFKKGILHQMPKSIMEILAEYLKVQVEAGQDKLLDRRDDVAKALS